MPEHSQKLVSYNGQSAEIDVEIADLIEDIWRLGLHTYNSCQDNFGYVWIEFASIADAEVFLTHVAQYTEHWDTPYDRMMCRGDDELDWKYSVYPVDYGVDETLVDDIIHEHFTGQHDLRFTMSVRFPRQDLLFIGNWWGEYSLTGEHTSRPCYSKHEQNMWCLYTMGVLKRRCKGDTIWP